MGSRSYGQHCALAKSLDLVGDRWTLLVVRELLDGPKRYVDLLAGLVSMSTDMLAVRLRALEGAGLVVRYRLPPPSPAHVYELTDEGARLEEVIHSFARWGRHLLETREPDDVVHPSWLVRAVKAYLRTDRGDMNLTLRLETPEGVATMRITGDAVEALADDAVADVTLTGTAEVLAGALDPDRAATLLATGALTVDGPAGALRSLARALSQPEPC